MANERQRQRLMQEALDERLNPEAYEELQQRLQTNESEAEEFARLNRVDRMLRTAPHERAPQRLALEIMARLARDLSPQQMSHLAGLALALGLALVTLVALPLLLSLSYILLSALGSAGLNESIHSVVSVLAWIIAAMEAVVQRLQGLLGTYPAAPLVVVAMIPLSLYWLLRTLSRRASDSEST
jgi:hypothetical protein